MRRMPDLIVAAKDAALLALADQCVMCGLCLPHCPTYRLDEHEAESPRGRIAFARQLGHGARPTAKAIEHLDRCLGCLSCQKVCPSNVRYDDILIRSRALLAPMRPAGTRVWRWLTPAWVARMVSFGVAVRARRWLPALACVLPANSLFRRIAMEMPGAPPPGAARSSTSAVAGHRGTVTLFPGCVARVLDRDTLDAARMLLEALGYRVVEPTRAVCCGALALHAGESQAASRNAADTRAALQALDSNIVLVSASGCLGSLRDRTLSGTTLTVDDVAAFIARDAALSTLRFSALNQRVALHVPCTQASVGDAGDGTRALLARIPDLDVLVLPEQPRCCGAAGTYFLEHPQHADRLREEKLGQVGAHAASVLLTSNIGCRIFLDNGLRRQGAAIPVLHPLALLARQLETIQP